MLVWLSPSLLLHPVFPWTKGHPLGICTRGFAAATHPHPHPHAEVPWARSTGSLPKPVVVGDAWTHPSGHPLAQSCIQSSSSSEIPPSPCLWDGEAVGTLQPYPHGYPQRWLRAPWATPACHLHIAEKYNPVFVNEDKYITWRAGPYNSAAWNKYSTYLPLPPKVGPGSSSPLKNWSPEGATNTSGSAPKGWQCCKGCDHSLQEKRMETYLRSIPVPYPPKPACLNQYGNCPHTQLQLLPCPCHPGAELLGDLLLAPYPRRPSACRAGGGC